MEYSELLDAITKAMSKGNGGNGGGGGSSSGGLVGVTDQSPTVAAQEMMDSLKQSMGNNWNVAFGQGRIDAVNSASNDGKPSAAGAISALGAISPVVWIAVGGGVLVLVFVLRKKK